MPNPWTLVDSSLPAARADGNPREQILEILEFLTVLTEALKYQLENLDENNVNGAALERMMPMRKDDQGNITLGAAGKELHLEGIVYINGNRIE